MADRVSELLTAATQMGLSDYLLLLVWNQSFLCNPALPLLAFSPPASFVLGSTGEISPVFPV